MRDALVRQLYGYGAGRVCLCTQRYRREAPLSLRQAAREALCLTSPRSLVRGGGALAIAGLLALIGWHSLTEDREDPLDLRVVPFDVAWIPAEPATPPKPDPPPEPNPPVRERTAAVAPQNIAAVPPDVVRPLARPERPPPPRPRGRSRAKAEVHVRIEALHETPLPPRVVARTPARASSPQTASSPRPAIQLEALDVPQPVAESPPAAATRVRRVATSARTSAPRPYVDVALSSAPLVPKSELLPPTEPAAPRARQPAPRVLRARRARQPRLDLPPAAEPEGADPDSGYRTARALPPRLSRGAHGAARRRPALDGLTALETPGRVTPVSPRVAAHAPEPEGLAPERGDLGRTLHGVPLGSLASCLSDREEDALKKKLLATLGAHTECESVAGRYQFIETKNLNAFLMWVERAPNRSDADRCVELSLALECLKQRSVTQGTV